MLFLSAVKGLKVDIFLKKYSYTESKKSLSYCLEGRRGDQELEKRRYKKTAKKNSENNLFILFDKIGQSNKIHKLLKLNFSLFPILAENIIAK